MGLERRGRADRDHSAANPQGEELRERSGPEVKPFEIDKRLIYEAWRKVRANKGAPGAGAVSIELCEQRWQDNLYKLWNRMSSGSYFPGPVRGVEIPKEGGKAVRLLGVPNTEDRVAQTAAAMLLEANRRARLYWCAYRPRPSGPRPAVSGSHPAAGARCGPVRGPGRPGDGRAGRSGRSVLAAASR
jgi:hypothetical protein